MQALMSSIQQILSQIIASKRHTLVNNLKAALYIHAETQTKKEHKALGLIIHRCEQNQPNKWHKALSPAPLHW